MTMTKTRITLTLITLAVVSVLLIIVGFFAKGYWFNLKTFKFIPRGILVIESEPTAAQIYIDNELKTATDATIRLSPGTYDVKVQKEGYITWQKRLTIEKETVTQAKVNLFKSAPSLTAATFSGVVSPVETDDQSKIAYAVPLTKDNGVDKAGLWVMETVNFPLGFSKDPKRITDGQLDGATWQWSPDGQEILLQTKTGVFLLDASQFTPQAQRINVASKKLEILKKWNEEKQRKIEAKIKPLPEDLHEILLNNATSILFSPDENKIMYTASSSAQIPDNLIKPIPGASTQKQERNIKQGKTYIYDIKEDRNFLVESHPKDKKVSWFATSNHVLIAEEGRVYISDYDGTNKIAVYEGAYNGPDAFPTLNKDRILILTNLGSISTPNLYSISLN